MLGKYSRLLLIFFLTSGLAACGDNESTTEKTAAGKSSTQKQTQVMEEVSAVKIPDSSSGIFHPVVYQEEIYKNWPYTDAPVVKPAVSSVTEVVEETITNVVSTSADKITEIQTTTNSVTHVINAEARIFKPDIIYISKGDTVRWTNMTSHNSVSVEGLIPEGAEHWRGNLGENLQISLGVEGVYSYVCEPHIGFGMVGVIVVGNPVNYDQVMAYATDNLQGPYRRLIGKLKKVKH